MNSKAQHDRLLDLQCRAAFGLSLTDLEVREIEALAASEGPGPGMATQAQKDYIDTLIDKLNADLADYDIDDLDELSFGAASELIDQLKDDVTDYEGWD